MTATINPLFTRNLRAMTLDTFTHPVDGATIRTLYSLAAHKEYGRRRITEFPQTAAFYPDGEYRCTVRILQDWDNLPSGMWDCDAPVRVLFPDGDVATVLYSQLDY